MITDGQSHLPAGLSKEYCATWTITAQTLKRQRCQAEKWMREDKDGLIQGDIGKFEKAVKDLTYDSARYNTLDKSYSRTCV